MIKQFDYIILGAGIYGLYISNILASKFPKRSILLLEKDNAPFSRASYINQARVHNGYHYPRSLHTAFKSAKYYDKFSKDFDFAINNEFKKIYAISEKFSYAGANDFQRFCEISNIPCEEISSKPYFKDGMVEASFLTEETSMDGKIIAKYLTEKLSEHKNVTTKYNFDFAGVENLNSSYKITAKNADVYSSDFVINTSYASVNQIIDRFGCEKFPIKYEIAELCLCDVSLNLKRVGLTIMDGPFFSLMPFGLSGYHSLSAVHFTPHKTSYEELPNFPCMTQDVNCSPSQLNNCNSCKNKPSTAWNKMTQLANKYLINNISYTFHESLMAIKPILKISEVSDSRPTVIHKHSDSPIFVSILSGKFNTIYDLEELATW